jgi:hypothetical protein
LMGRKTRRSPLIHKRQNDEFVTEPVGGCESLTVPSFDLYG